MRGIVPHVLWVAALLCGEDVLGAQQEESRPFSFARLRTEIAFAADADFDGAPGSMSLRSAVGEVGSMVPLAPGALVGPLIGYRNTRVDFDNFILGGVRITPFDEIHESTLGLQWRQQLGQDWGLFTIGGFTNAITTGADFNDGWKPRLITVASYRASAALTLGFGAVGSYDLDDKLRVFPVISIDWRPTERWQILVRNDVSVSYLVHTASSLRVGLSSTFAGRFGGRTFRLSERGPLPNGIGEIEAQSVGLEVRVAPSERISLRGVFGAITNYELTLRTRGKVRVFDEGLDAAPFASFEAVIQF